VTVRRARGVSLHRWRAWRTSEARRRHGGLARVGRTVSCRCPQRRRAGSRLPPRGSTRAPRRVVLLCRSARIRTFKAVTHLRPRARATRRTTAASDTTTYCHHLLRPGDST
jgi:hypothetical protein